MNKNARFIHGGGWVKTFEHGRLITRWLIFVTAVSSPLFLGGMIFAPPNSPIFWQSMLTFPLWILYVPTPVLTIVSMGAFFMEPPRTIVSMKRNPNYDPHNLY